MERSSTSRKSESRRFGNPSASLPTLASSFEAPRPSTRAAARAQYDMNRSEFTRLAGLAALGAAGVPEFVACGSSQARGQERVVIVGAGIAGLVTAMHLRDAGIDSTVYESSSRIGGRMHSERSYWDAGQHTEWCGAMVDSTHVNIHQLARRFNLALLDTHAAWPPRARDTCYLDGRYYSMSEADQDFAQIYPILQEQLAKVDPTTTYATATPTARRLDLMSMRDWIERYVPGGVGSQLGRLVKESYRNEYGREIDELSALNLVLQLGQQRVLCPESRDERAGLFRSALHSRRWESGASRSDRGVFARGQRAARPPSAGDSAQRERVVRAAFRSSRRDRNGLCGSRRARASVHRVARARLFERRIRFGEGQCDRESRLRLSHEAPPPVRPARVDARDTSVARAHDGTDLDDVARRRARSIIRSASAAPTASSKSLLRRARQCSTRLACRTRGFPTPRP